MTEKVTVDDFIIAAFGVNVENVKTSFGGRVTSFENLSYQLQSKLYEKIEIHDFGYRSSFSKLGGEEYKPAVERATKVNSKFDLDTIISVVETLNLDTKEINLHNGLVNFLLGLDKSWSWRWPVSVLVFIAICWFSVFDLNIAVKTGGGIIDYAFRDWSRFCYVSLIVAVFSVYFLPFGARFARFLRDFKWKKFTSNGVDYNYTGRVLYDKLKGMQLEKGDNWLWVIYSNLNQRYAGTAKETLIEQVARLQNDLEYKEKQLREKDKDFEIIRNQNIEQSEQNSAQKEKIAELTAENQRITTQLEEKDKAFNVCLDKQSKKIESAEQEIAKLQAQVDELTKEKQSIIDGHDKEREEILKEIDKKIAEGVAKEKNRYEKLNNDLLKIDDVKGPRIYLYFALIQIVCKLSRLSQSTITQSIGERVKFLKNRGVRIGLSEDSADKIFAVVNKVCKDKNIREEYFQFDPRKPIEELQDKMDKN